MAVIDQVKGAAGGIRKFWDEQPPKRKKIIIAVGGIVLAVALIATVVLNIQNAQYTVLFQGITPTEASEVYATLQTDGVPVRMNSKGQVEVPSERVDSLIFSLQSQGFPKTAPPYDVFLTNIGPTTTSYAAREITKYQLQDRIQISLPALDGIKSAIVTISLPEQSGLAWTSSDDEVTASVILTLSTAGTLAPEKVTTIKKVVAASIQGCKAENVVVTDASTSIELDDSSTGSFSYSLQQFDYERMLSKRAEDSMKKLYTPSYGVEGIAVSAAYTIDTDKMKEESKIFQKGEDGQGFQTHYDEQYTANGGIPSGGVVGEENNTDIPDYVADEDGDADNVTDFNRSIDYENSYVLRQIERGSAPIKYASMSLLLNDDNLTAARQDEIAAVASKATGIAVEDITIGSLNAASIPADVGEEEVPFFRQPMFLMALAGAMLLVCVTVIVIPVLLSRKRKRKESLRMQELEAEQSIAAEAAQRAQSEVDMHKNKLKYEAEAQMIQDGSMTQEIRTFAKENPEMTATLIRSLLKEEG